MTEGKRSMKLDETNKDMKKHALSISLPFGINYLLYQHSVCICKCLIFRDMCLWEATKV